MHHADYHDYILRQRRRREIADARDTARLLLAGWYAHGAHQADVLSPKIQIEENFHSLSTMPKLNKNVKDGYVMICSRLDETPRPVVLKLDYDLRPDGGLTYRMMYDQVRSALQLPAKASLRLSSWRPWFRYSNDIGGVPERSLLPSSGKDARALLGTTLFFYSYISLNRKNPHHLIHT